ncbi:MAG: DUF5106 domain-containing protein [Ekhidna sp.]|nr:DUF5106 domain-containing protein [Ekhidna sp.]
MKIILKLFFLYSFFISFRGNSQGYEIKVKIEGAQEADLLLGYYLSGKTYLKDTAKYMDGDFTFSGSEPLDHGMYLLVQNGNLLFDLVIGKDQSFSIKTTFDDYINSIEVDGDKDNQLFFDNMRLSIKRNEEAAPHVAILKDSTSTEEAKVEARKHLEVINDKLDAYFTKTMESHPGSITAVIVGTNKRLKIPDEEAAKLAIDNDEARFSYYRNHFWDNIDLGNPILLRMSTPVYEQKVDEYMDKLIAPVPDAIKKAADKLIEVAKKNEDTYQFLVWHLTYKYQSSRIMGMDEVYVHLVDKYFLTGEMDFWANDQLKSNLKEKADQYRNSLIGMLAPNLILQNLKRQPKALHDLPNDYSVIYFYDPDCGHCKRETPVLKAFYDSTAFNVGVYTVSADTSMTKMNNYVEEMGLQDWVNTNGTKTYSVNYQEFYDAFTTPTIYLLNDKKEIIAKKITASQLEEIITKYEQTQNEKAGN